MKEYLENTLHQSVLIEDTFDSKDFPISVRNNYHFYYLTIGNSRFIVIRPNDKANLPELRRIHKLTQKLTKQKCALYRTDVTYYSVSKMIEDNIPFIIEGKQVYLPFLGLSLDTTQNKKVYICDSISFLTQKLLLTAIYQKWEKVNITQAANSLNVTTAAVTKCFNEIEALDIPVLKRYGRSRYIIGASDRKGFWNKTMPYLISPLIKNFYLRNDIAGDLVKSGMSALSVYSLLSDNEYPTYAVTKDRIKEISCNRIEQIGKEETPGCVIQELGYYIPFRDFNTVDPLTVSLLITGEEKEDPRISMAIDEMLEEYVW